MNKRSASPRMIRHRSIGRSRMPRFLGRGQSLVEFALILPVFMLLLLGAVDFGRIFFSYIQIRNAAGQGASYGAVNPTDHTGIVAKVQQETNTQAQRGENTVVVSEDCKDAFGGTILCSVAAGADGAGNIITVSVAERFNFFTPLMNGFFSNNFSIKAAASAAVLSLAPGNGGGGQTGCTPPSSATFTYSVTNFGINVNASPAEPSAGQWAISSYLWTMGDGLDPFPPITGIQASYTYQTAGLYSITLEVQNQCGSLSSTQSVAIGSAPTASPGITPAPTVTPTVAPSPTASPCNTSPSFTYQFTGQGNGSKKHQMTFQGAYSGSPAPNTWAWTFGSGGQTGTGQNLSNDYASAGTFTVQLTVTNGSCVRNVSQSVVVP